MTAVDPASVDAATQALMDNAGCTEDRAHEIVEAVVRAATDEALSTISGASTVSGSAVDMRLLRLRRILEQLGDAAAPLHSYEVGTVFQITPSQGATLLRTYQARYAQDVRKRMEKKVGATAKTATRKGVGSGGKFVFDFPDAATLDYAADRLRRHGYEKSLAVDRPQLQLTIDRDLKAAGGRDAVEFLKGDGPKS
jgi:hypothetical protein